MKWLSDGTWYIVTEQLAYTAAAAAADDDDDEEEEDEDESKMYQWRQETN